MKRIFLLGLLSLFFLACSDDDDKGGEGYLKNLESAKSGVLGSWETTVGGKRYHYYDANGNKCDGFYPDRDWILCGSYEVLKSGSDYILRIYVINGTSNDYDDWIIQVLNEKELVTSAKDGTQLSRQIRV